MPIEVKNSRGLIDPDNLKLKMLIYALPGTGKTTFCATAPNPGFIACETGHGAGLISVAGAGVDYCIPKNLPELELIASGMVFKDKETEVGDSLSEMARSFIKDYALAIPRKKGETEKRKSGVPELDDYGVMGEVTRRLVRKFLDLDKHIIFTATERYQQPDEDTPGSELLIGPDLPGQMFLGSTAMFDLVLRMRTRVQFRDPKDAKSKYTQRYFITERSGSTIAKCRLSLPTKLGVAQTPSLLPAEVVVNYQTGEGTFPWMLDTIQKGYQKFLEEQPL